MYKGVVVESSLTDPKVLRKFKVDRSYKDGAWTLYEVRATEEQLPQLQRQLVEGPWYMHFWEEGGDEIKVVFKERMFDILYSKKDTWKDAVTYGQSLGIPTRQLDFAID